MRAPLSWSRLASVAIHIERSPQTYLRFCATTLSKFRRQAYDTATPMLFLSRHLPPFLHAWSLEVVTLPGLIRRYFRRRASIISQPTAGLRGAFQAAQGRKDTIRFSMTGAEELMIRRCLLSRLSIYRAFTAPHNSDASRRIACFGPLICGRDCFSHAALTNTAGHRHATPFLLYKAFTFDFDL